MDALPNSTSPSRPAGPSVASASTTGEAPFRQLTLGQWQRHAETHPERTAFHHRRWIELLVRQYGGRLMIPAVECENGSLTAIPFVECRGLSGRRKLVSLPFSDCVPVLFSHGTEAGDSFQVAMRRLAQHPALQEYSAAVVRSDVPFSDPPCGQAHAFRHTLDLNGPIDDIAARYHNGIKRNLKRARSHDLGFEPRTDRAAIEIFYRLHLLTRRKHGVPIQPRSFFRQLQEQILAEGLGYVGVVSRSQEPVAAGVFLTFGRTTIYKYGASNPAALDSRPNEWLMHRAIESAHEGGYTLFDFGLTDQHNEGLRRFKLKWGAVESGVYHEFLVGRPGKVGRDSSMIRIVRPVIRHGPSFVCELLGKLFYRYSQ